MTFFPGQGKVREFGFESGKFAKSAESQGKVREFQIFLKSDGLWQCINVINEFEKVNFFLQKLNGFQFLRISVSFKFFKYIVSSPEPKAHR